MDAKDAPRRKRRWRPGFVRLWIAGTLVLLLATGFVLRPDRDATRYLSDQDIDSAESNLQVRQLMTHAHVLQGKGLTSEQIESELLNGGSLTHDARRTMLELEAALGTREQARKRLILFATIALFPPLLILELAAGLFWAWRGLRAWRKASGADPLISPASFG
jgi:hypothetical protein